jgi:hypothetical protein
MEEQEERLNPINEKHLMNNGRENAMRLTGQGATPSMGLSEYRGGKHTLLDHLENPKKGYGKKKADCEAREMGKHLGKHILGLHGGAFYQGFSDGFLEGGRLSDEDEERQYQADKAKGVTRTPGRDMSKPVKSVEQMRAETNQKARDSRSTSEKVFSKINHGLAEAGRYALKNVDKVLPGTGAIGNYVADNIIPKTRGDGHSEDQRAQMLQMREGAPRQRLNTPSMRRRGGNMLTQPMPVQGTNLSLSGQGMTGAYEGQGKPKRHNKRAEIVRKVMAEKGLKMIEASKYVKAHNLY